MKKYEVLVLMSSVALEKHFVKGNAYLERELREVIRYIGMTLKGKVFASRNIAAEGPFNGETGGYNFQKALAITDQEDFLVLSLALAAVCNFRGSWQFKLSGRGITLIELRNEKPVNPRNDPYVIELKLDSEVGS